MTLTVTLTSSLVVGAALVATGAFAAARRQDGPGALVSIPAMAAGAAVALAGASRFAALPQDPVSGQELAALVCLAALAGTLLGAAWSRPQPRDGGARAARRGERR